MIDPPVRSSSCARASTLNADSVPSRSMAAASGGALTSRPVMSSIQPERRSLASGDAGPGIGEQPQLHPAPAVVSSESTTAQRELELVGRSEELAEVPRFLDAVAD